MVLGPGKDRKIFTGYSPLCFSVHVVKSVLISISGGLAQLCSNFGLIFQMASTLVGTVLDPDPSLALLNQNTLDRTRAQFALCYNSWQQTKQTIACAWKSLTLCTIESKHRVIQTMIHSKIIQQLFRIKFSNISKFGNPGWITSFC